MPIQKCKFLASKTWDGLDDSMDLVICIGSFPTNAENQSRRDNRVRDRSGKPAAKGSHHPPPETDTHFAYAMKINPKGDKGSARTWNA